MVSIRPEPSPREGASMVGRSAQASVELSSTKPPNRNLEQVARSRASGRWQRPERFMASSPDYDSMKNISTIRARARRSVLPPSEPKLMLPAAQPRYPVHSAQAHQSNANTSTDERHSTELSCGVNPATAENALSWASVMLIGLTRMRRLSAIITAQLSQLGRLRTGRR
ncbi:hypothetical protein D3C80_464010 [compost metagenome]